ESFEAGGKPGTIERAIHAAAVARIGELVLPLNVRAQWHSEIVMQAIAPYVIRVGRAERLHPDVGELQVLHDRIIAVAEFHAGGKPSAVVWTHAVAVVARGTLKMQIAHEPVGRVVPVNVRVVPLRRKEMRGILPRASKRPGGFAVDEDAVAERIIAGRHG